MPDDSIWDDEEDDGGGGVREPRRPEPPTRPPAEEEAEPEPEEELVVVGPDSAPDRESGAENLSASPSAPRTTAGAQPCSRWMYHRPGVYCHVCGKIGQAKQSIVVPELRMGPLPPGGKAKPNFKKGKR